MVVIDDPKKEFYFDAIASFKVIKTLGFVAGIIASATMLFPKFIMSYFYRLIAKNRHLIVGKSDLSDLLSDAEKSFSWSTLTSLNSYLRINPLMFSN